MTESSGYQVAPGQLNDFASYLDTTTVSEIDKSAEGVNNANKFDVDAFGVALAQAMGVPCRIAMGVVASDLKKLSDKVTSDAKATRDTATRYASNDQNVATTFTDLRGA